MKKLINNTQGYQKIDNFMTCNAKLTVVFLNQINHEFMKKATFEFSRILEHLIYHWKVTLFITLKRAISN